MALLAVLQIGNALASESTASVLTGNSVLCTLTTFDSETQLETNADASSTQVLCNCTLSAGTYAAGSLIAVVPGASPSVPYANVNPVTSSGGVVTGVLFQAQVPGPTAALAPSTLTQVASGTPGFTAVTNPAAQSQLGAYSVTAVLFSPLGNQTAMTVTSPSIGVYQATTPPLTIDGTYAVQFSGTSDSGAFDFVTQGAVNATAGT